MDEANVTLNGASGPLDRVIPLTGPAVPGFLDRKGAAAFLGNISVSKLDQLVARGELPVIHIGCRVAFDPEDLLEWARARKTRGTLPCRRRKGTAA